MLDSDDHPAQRRPSTGRPIFKYGPKKKAKQFKNTVVSYSERLSVIQYYDTCGMQATLNTFYDNCTMAARETMRKKVYSWVANRDHITRMAASPTTAKLKCWRPMGTGTTLTMEAEEQLAHWVLGMRKDGVPVTQAMIRIMALESAVDLGLEDHEFLAGWHWVHGFKRRHGLSLRSRTRIGQDTPKDGIAVLEAFAARVDAIVKENDIDVIYNADQTAVNYEYLPTKTINKTGEKTIWVKCGGKTKERVTAMLLADSTGTKHPLFLVMKTAASKIKAVVQENLQQRQGFGKTVWKSIVGMQDDNNCRIYGNPTAWWNAQVSLKFLEYHFGQRPDRATKKVLLIWDDFSAHFTEDVVAYAKSINVVLERVPPRYTWICQPADVAWNRPLKFRLRQEWLDLIRRQLRNVRKRHVPFKLQPPSRATIVAWIVKAWLDLPSTIIVNGFRKCRLVEGSPVDEDVPGGIMDEAVFAQLTASCAIEDTIDPESDFSNTVDEEGDETIVL
ncbi:hypothetical protein B5M09_010340 [Aphanomyces astaci]|uniref:HTH CENPB-type domain-containing protein n=1 Tax=Aphanomyces astaci TaxID=112090 RepID=A0A3R8D4V4_APHAT|nr:hypothetical protein B5M09_010340 [Aphanomyces astaci]